MEDNMKTDIFEDMKDYIGCNDVSDLPYRKREVWGRNQTTATA